MHGLEWGQEGINYGSSIKNGAWNILRIWPEYRLHIYRQNCKLIEKVKNTRTGEIQNGGTLKRSIHDAGGYGEDRPHRDVVTRNGGRYHPSIGKFG